MINFIKSKIEDSINLKSSLLSNTEILNAVNETINEIVTCYKTAEKFYGAEMVEVLQMLSIWPQN